MRRALPVISPKGALYVQLLLWVALAFTVSVVYSRRLWIPISIVILSALFVPVIAARVLVGAGLPRLEGTYPATFFIAVLAGTQLLLRMKEYVRDLSQSVILVIVLSTFVGAAAVVTYFVTGLSGLALLINQVVTPILLFVVIRRALADDPRTGRRLALVVIAGATVESVVSILVSMRLMEQPFAENYKLFYWYTADFKRALGTTDHPLVLGSFMLLAIALLVVIRNTALQAVLVTLFLATLFLAESRTGLFLSVFAIAFLLVRGHASLPSRLLLIVALTCAGIFSANSALTEGVTEKLADDSGSGAVRGIAVGYVLARISEFAVLGRGPGADVEIAREAGLGTSLENPFLVYAINYGAIFTALYFGAQFLIPLTARRRPRAVPGARLGALLVLVSAQTFSSLSAVSSLAAFVWVALALAAPPLVTPVEASEGRTRPYPLRCTRGRIVGVPEL